ncbi:MAG: flagellar hook-length control protein FliK [Halothiobacillaceae bacterium]
MADIPLLMKMGTEAGKSVKGSGGGLPGALETLSGVSGDQAFGKLVQQALGAGQGMPSEVDPSELTRVVRSRLTGDGQALPYGMTQGGSGSLGESIPVGLENPSGVSVNPGELTQVVGSRLTGDGQALPDAMTQAGSGSLEETIVASIEQIMRASGKTMEGVSGNGQPVSTEDFEASLEQLLGRLSALTAEGGAEGLDPKALMSRLKGDLERMGLSGDKASLAVLGERLAQQMESRAGALLEGLSEGLRSLEQSLARLDSLLRKASPDGEVVAESLGRIGASLDELADALDGTGLSALEDMLDDLRAQLDGVMRRAEDSGELDLQDIRQFMGDLNEQLASVREAVGQYTGQWSSENDGDAPQWLADLRETLTELEQQFDRLQSTIEAREGQPVVVAPSVGDWRAALRESRGSETVDRSGGRMTAAATEGDARPADRMGTTMPNGERERPADEAMTAGQWLRARESAGRAGAEADAPGAGRNAAIAGDLSEGNALRKQFDALLGEAAEKAAPKTRLAEAIDLAVQSARQRNDSPSPLRTEQLERSQSMLQGGDLNSASFSLNAGRDLDAGNQVRLAPIPVAVNHPKFAEAMGQRVTFMVNQNVQQARISLNPANMGPVSVQLEVRGDEAVVHMMAAQGTTREALEAAIPRLREMLGENGFSQVSVSVGQQGGQGAADSGGSGGEGAATAGADDRGGQSGETGVEGEDGGLSVTEVSVGDRRLDLFA